MKKFLYLLNKALLITSICCTCYFTYKIIETEVQYFQAQKTFNNLKNIYASTEGITPNISESEKLKQKQQKLKNLNHDFRGWIKIPDTNINYPIVQSKDNKFYLFRNFYKEYSKSGSIFLDFENTGIDNQNVIIYGHNMKDQSMFHNLRYYKSDPNYLNNHKFIFIETNVARYKFEIFSTYVTNDDFYYLKTQFNSVDEHSNFIHEIKSKSSHKSNIDIQYDDTILTLSTCSYAYENARNVIHAKLINKELL